MNIALFGTIFMDIKGFSEHPYDPVGRNVGDVRFIHGGVGRNVAENLSVLGIPVTFGSTVDASAIGEAVVTRLNEHKIDTSYIKKVASGGMGMWLAILDQNGDLAGSISQMPDLRLFEMLLAEKGDEIISKATHVALEIDLNDAIAQRIVQTAARLGRPIYAIPGNLEVTKKNKELLSAMECFICNDIEAEKLFPAYLDTADISRMKAQLEKFAEKMRMKSMVVTMGERGAVYYERGAGAAHESVRPVKMLDSTGAGDSFFSGVTAALIRGKSLAQAVRFGAKVAAYTIQSKESTCLGFSERID